MVAGKSIPKLSVDTQELPNALDVSSILQQVPSRKHESVTALLGAWSELLYHDLVRPANFKNRQCCKRDAITHQECYRLQKDDRCWEYMRSLPAIEVDSCEFSKLMVEVLRSSYSRLYISKI